MIQLAMGNDKVKLKSKDSLAVMNYKESYFMQKPPDCSLFSEEGHEILIHKELLYQTKFMLEILKSSNCCSCKIEIFFPSLQKEDLKDMVKFLYTGEITYKDQRDVHEVLVNLTNFLGFPIPSDMTIKRNVPIPQFVHETTMKKNDDIETRNEIKVDFFATANEIMSPKNHPKVLFGLGTKLTNISTNTENYTNQSNSMVYPSDSSLENRNTYSQMSSNLNIIENSELDEEVIEIGKSFDVKEKLSNEINMVNAQEFETDENDIDNDARPETGEVKDSYLSSEILNNLSINISGEIKEDTYLVQG